MTEATTVTLVTGPNRGLGRGILTALLTRPNNTVIASVRDPQAPISQTLNDLPKATGTTLHIVKIDAAIPTDAATAVKTLEATGITHVDTVIANAAIGTVESVLNTAPDSVRQNFNVNLIGVLTLFQAFEPLLRKSQTGNPKFVALSSVLGSIALAPTYQGPWFAYGVTKVAVNYLVKRIHVEHEWLTAVALQPGWLETDMGNLAATSVGMEKAPMKLEDGVRGCLEVIDAASREKYAGQFVSSELEVLPW